MATFYYILSALGAIIGFLFGWGISPHFISKLDRFAESTFKIFMKRLGIAIGCGAIPFYIFVALAEGAEKTKNVQATTNTSISKPTTVETPKQPDVPSATSVHNTNANPTASASTETPQNTQQPALATSIPITVAASESTPSKAQTPVAGLHQEPAQMTWAPSFDCAKVSTGAERLICSNKQLSEADVNLNQAYKAALNSSSDKASLKGEQNAWRKKERDACADVDCMAKAYQQRISQLSR